MKLLTVCGATLGSTNVIVKSPRDVCTVAVYFLAGSITVGGGVVRCSMQVTISLSQPGANEVVAGGPPPASHAESASRASAAPRICFTRETLRDHLVGSRALVAIRTASARASPAMTISAVGTPAVAATPPPMAGPMLKPSATELALAPKTVLCASGGVSSPIMLAVAGMTTPLNRPLSATPTTTTATQGATPMSETAIATITEAMAVVLTYPKRRVTCVEKIAAAL